MFSYIKYLKYFFYKKYPVEITFFVTANCNFRCRHCFNWKKIKKFNPQNELSIKEIRQMTKTIPPFLRLSLSGGEPFLRNDLVEICQAFYENCHIKFITIPTNASLPKKIIGDVEKILTLCPKLFLHISISVDGLGKDRDNIVGRKNTFKKLIETARKLKKLKNKYANLKFGVITTQTPNNEKQLDKIYKFCLKTLKVDNFGFNLVRMNPKDKKETNADLIIYKRFTQKLANDKGPSVFSFPFSALFAAKKNIVFKQVLKINKEKKYQSACYSGKLRVVIDELGNIYPCETLQYCNNKNIFLMGNIREYKLDFKKVFFSPKAQKIKNHIKKTKCFCAHECDLETNILFNLKYFPQLFFEAIKNILK